MKCTGIRIGDINSKDKRTLEQFVGSAEARSPLGKLLIALTQETAWSGEYTVSASFDKEPRLHIGHKTFLSERSLSITTETYAEWSVRHVEDAVREHLRYSQESMRPAISILQGKVNDMQQALEQIAVDKAMAAIVAIFSEAVDIIRIPTTGRDLYAFFKGIGRGPIYVARGLDREFVGGVARIDCSDVYWYGLQDGVEKGQRHGLFWAELARAFAARELGVPEKELRCASVSATEKPWKWPQIEPYIVEKVVLRASGEKENIIVLFGVNNLPAKAYRELPSQVEA